MPFPAILLLAEPLQDVPLSERANAIRAFNLRVHILESEDRVVETGLGNALGLH